MSLVLHDLRSHEAWDGGCALHGAGGYSATVNVATKLLLKNEKGLLIPCSFQYWCWGSADDGVADGRVRFVAIDEKPIDPKDLTVVREVTFKSHLREGKDFEEIITRLMLHTADAQYVIFTGYGSLRPGYFLVRKDRRRCENPTNTHYLSLYNLLPSSQVTN